MQVDAPIQQLDLVPLDRIVAVNSTQVASVREAEEALRKAPCGQLVQLVIERREPAPIWAGERRVGDGDLESVPMQLSHIFTLSRFKPFGCHTRCMGLKWQNVGSFPPAGRELLSNEQLQDALAEGRTDFTKEEFAAFDVFELRAHHVIKAGSSYFEPFSSITDWLGFQRWFGDEREPRRAAYVGGDSNKVDGDASHQRVKRLFKAHGQAVLAVTRNAPSSSDLESGAPPDAASHKHKRGKLRPRLHALSKSAPYAELKLRVVENPPHGLEELGPASVTDMKVRFYFDGIDRGRVLSMNSRFLVLRMDKWKIIRYSCSCLKVASLYVTAAGLSQLNSKRSCEVALRLCCLPLSLQSVLNILKSCYDEVRQYAGMLRMSFGTPPKRQRRIPQAVSFTNAFSTQDMADLLAFAQMVNFAHTQLFSFVPLMRFVDVLLSHPGQDGDARSGIGILEGGNEEECRGVDGLQDAGPGNGKDGNEGDRADRELEGMDQDEAGRKTPSGKAVDFDAQAMIISDRWVQPGWLVGKVNEELKSQFGAVLVSEEGKGEGAWIRYWIYEMLLDVNPSPSVRQQALQSTRSKLRQCLGQALIMCVTSALLVIEAEDRSPADVVLLVMTGVEAAGCMPSWFVHRIGSFRCLLKALVVFLAGSCVVGALALLLPGTFAILHVPACLVREAPDSKGCYLMLSPPIMMALLTYGRDVLIPARVLPFLGVPEAAFCIKLASQAHVALWTGKVWAESKREFHVEDAASASNH